jgi:hypothetical protein
MATPSTATPSPTRIPPARSSMPPASPTPAATPIPPASPLPNASPIPERSGQEAQLPFAGYDRLNVQELKRELSDHTQIELEAAESYERSHEDREAVLDKLRYLRGSEPFPGYDAISVEEIVAALEKADLATIKRVRDYERKFANRRQLVEEVVRVQHERRATEPASAAPAYQPASARSGASRGRARKAGGR